ncbi:MAG: hypothetical protein GY820_22480 [Gammaproteobacteria bacterium]|nr:hypothetical protein [Gammaproteobacteria bacterium]
MSLSKDWYITYRYAVLQIRDVLIITGNKFFSSADFLAASRESSRDEIDELIDYNFVITDAALNLDFTPGFANDDMFAKVREALAFIHGHVMDGSQSACTF